jgi:hypothetical protein
MTAPTPTPFRDTTPPDCHRYHAAGVAEGYRRALSMAKAFTREALIAWLETQVGEHTP